jgi:proteic killer suppression protein
MITSFKDQATENIFNGINSKAARKALPITLFRSARRKLDQLDSVQDIDERRVPPGNKLEALIGNRMGEYSIRINDQYRICFKWDKAEPFDVEITDYH